MTDKTPCPCDSCPLWNQCKVNHTACHRFAKYAISGYASNAYCVSASKRLRAGKLITDRPTAFIYDLIFCGMEKPPKSMIRDAVASITKD
jgi:hypothetical protein